MGCAPGRQCTPHVPRPVSGGALLACPCVTAVALQLPIVWSNSPWLLTAQLFLALGFPWWILGSPFLFHPKKLLDFQVHWIDRVGENGHLWWRCYPTYEYGVTSFLLRERLTFLLLLDLTVGISCHWGCLSCLIPSMIIDDQACQ